MNTSFTKGMTLLEVLVAMALMVVISAISFASLNGLIDAKVHTDKVAIDMRQELLTSQQLSKDFKSIIHRKIKNQYGETQRAIEGSYSTIHFSRNGHNNPLKQNRAELQRIQWFLKDNTLTRRWLDQMDQGLSPRWRQRPYLNDVNQLTFTYTNASGQELANWPESELSALKFIHVQIDMKNGARLNYHFSIL